MEIESFEYRKQSLFCERVSLERIASEVGTPTYVYSKQALLSRVVRLQKSAPGCSIFYAMKASGNLHLLRLLREAGCGVDIVSGGELFRARKAGISGEKIVFSGVGKTEKEITEAIEYRIRCFNVESVDELLLIEQVAARMNTNVRVALRINPNIDAKTHPYISTGLKRNKFGLSKDELTQIASLSKKLKHAQISGLSCHIGSQILQASPLEQAWKHLIKTAKNFPYPIKFLDLGGGLGISYGPEKELSLEKYGALIGKVFKNEPYELGIEPGRCLVGPTAVLLTTLLNVKKQKSRLFYIVDAAMNDLMRPALYGAIHPLYPTRLDAKSKLVRANIVGPVCESSDTFEANAKVPIARAGDHFAFLNSGAYGMSMASQYNARPRAAEVLVDGDRYTIIRERENYESLIQNENF